jgi:hypothetical protein
MRKVQCSESVADAAVGELRACGAAINLRECESARARVVTV